MRDANHVVLRDGAAYDAMPPCPRRLRWFYFNTCGRVHTLTRRGSVRRRQKFGGPVALFDRQGGDGLTQLPDGGPLAVSVLHAYWPSRSLRSLSIFALV